MVLYCKALTTFFASLPLPEIEIVKEVEEENEDDDLGDDGSNVFGYAKLMKEKERQKLVNYFTANLKFI